MSRELDCINELLGERENESSDKLIISRKKVRSGRQSMVLPDNRWPRNGQK